jgi:hypothetical protein
MHRKKLIRYFSPPTTRAASVTQVGMVCSEKEKVFIALLKGDIKMYLCMIIDRPLQTTSWYCIGVGYWLTRSSVLHRCDAKQDSQYVIGSCYNVVCETYSHVLTKR